MDTQAKSRFSVFGKFAAGSGSKPPRVPEKDAKWYMQGASKSSVSLAPSTSTMSMSMSSHTSSMASASVETLQLPPQTPLNLSPSGARSQYDLSRTMTPASTRSRTTTMTASTVQGSEMSSFRRGISMLSSSFGKRPKLFLRANSSASRTNLAVDGMRPSEDGTLESGSEESVSRPYNVQHHLHVDEGLSGLPPEWIEKLRATRQDASDILSIHSRRNRTTYLQNHPDVSPDTISARSRSPYSPASTSASPNSLSPLPSHTLPKRSSSFHRPTNADDAASISSYARSGGAHSPNSSSPPSSHGSTSSPSSRPSLSSTATSIDGADYDDDDYADPGTATAAQFMTTPGVRHHTPAPTRALPRTDDNLPPRTPPSRAATATFRVVNASPPSPPPAYAPSEPGSAQTQTFPRDEKSGAIVAPTVATEEEEEEEEGRRASTSTVQRQGERKSEETLTPEVMLRSEGSSDGPLGRIARATNESPGARASPPPFRLHLSKPSRDETSSPSPPESPVERTSVLPPRLSLHQDDLSSWSASLFSAMSTPDPEHDSFAESSASSTSITPTSAPTSVLDPAPAPTPTPNSLPAAKMTPKPTSTATRTKKSPVPPLVLSRPSNNVPGLTIETEEESIEHGAGTSTPLFDEVLSLVRPTEDNLSAMTSTYPYLPSPPAVPPSPDYSTQSHTLSTSSNSPNQTYEFLNQHYDPQRESRASTSTGSRDSQATISTSRWSRATTTTVRDVRDATIAVAHVRKPSVANAMTVPAPSRHAPQLSESTVRSGESGGSNGSRPMSSTSSDGVSVSFPTASDFPMPPPSPGDATSFSVSSAQASPLSATFSARSTGSTNDEVTLPYAATSARSVNGLSSPTSLRSSQSSSGSGSSSSSSQVNPLSIASESDEGPEEQNACSPGAVHVELRYTESESEGSVLSPTDSAESEMARSKWSLEQEKVDASAQFDIAPRIFTPGGTDVNGFDMDRIYCEHADGDDGDGDGASAVVDWLEESPSPNYELRDKPIRDSIAVYNHLSEPYRGLSPQVRRPSLQINDMPTLGTDDGPQSHLQLPSPGSVSISPTSQSSESTPSTTPSPLQRYRGWVSEVVAPIEEFIDHTIDPRELFTDMQEIAEGESGSVFVATIVPLPPTKMASKRPKERQGKVAVKQVPLLPGGSPKLGDLRKELMLMSRITHENVMSMDALFVDLVDDALWIEMELMERSLADVLALAEEGLVLQETVIARFTGDILNALAYLDTHGIVHRDVRSDNLLVNSQGVLKIADFSHGLLVDSTYPTYTDPAGVIYWQAPEMRSGAYDARKVDVWSAGATAWEMAEAEPPFMDLDVKDPQQLPTRWPALSQSDIYSPSFHDFLLLCSNPPLSRPSPNDLLMTPFIRSASARSLIVELLAQCRSIEERVHRRLSSDSQGTILS